MYFENGNIFAKSVLTFVDICGWKTPLELLVV
jgi:hypothetical protein